MSSGLIHREVPPPVNNMTVSLESKEESDVVAAARVLTPVTVERPKSERQARLSLLIRMLALINGGQRHVNIQLEIAYSFQISVDEVKLMHIYQTLCNIHKLNASVKGPTVQKMCIQVQCGSRWGTSE